MAITVKRIVLWRGKVDDQAGALAGVLEPLARAGADLQLLMGYREHGGKTTAVVEVYPVSAAKAKTAAQRAGLAASEVATLLVTGTNKPGLGAALARALGDAGISILFLVVLVSGRRFSAIFGFDTEGDAARATAFIKKTAAGKKK